MTSRVLIISELFTGGGVETQIASQVSALGALGVETFVATGIARDDEVKRLHAKLSISGLALGSGVTIDQTLGTVEKLCQLVEREGVDLIHCHPFLSSLVGVLVAQRTRRPLVYTLHGPASLELNYGRLYRDLLIEIVLPSCSTVFCVSKEAEIIARSLADGRFVLLPNAVDVERSQHAEIVSQCWAWVGRLDEQKAIGLKDLIVKAKDLKVEVLHIYGDGPARADLESFARLRVGGDLNIEFKGWIPGVDQHFSSYSVIAGMGRVALEAMACGTQVLLVGYDGVKGFLDQHFVDVAAAANFSGRNIRTINAAEIHHQWMKIKEQDRPAELNAWVNEYGDRRVIWARYLGLCERLRPMQSAAAQFLSDAAEMRRTSGALTWEDTELASWFRDFVSSRNSAQVRLLDARANHGYSRKALTNAPSRDIGLGASDINMLRSSLAHLRMMLNDRDEQIARLWRELGVRAREVERFHLDWVSVRADLTERDNQIAELKREMATRDNRLAQLDGLLLESEQARRSMERKAATSGIQYSLRLAQLDAGLRDLGTKAEEITALRKGLAGLSAELKEREGRIAHLEEMLREREEQIAQKERDQRSLEQVTATENEQYLQRLAALNHQRTYWEAKSLGLLSSTSWKFTAPLRAASESLRLVLRRSSGASSRFSHLGYLYRAKGARFVATWLWTRLAEGREATLELLKAAEDWERSAFTLWRTQQMARLMILRRRIKRVAEIGRNQGITSSATAVHDYIKRSYFRFWRLRRSATNGAFACIERQYTGDQGAYVPPHVGAHRSDGHLVTMLVEAFTDGGLERVTIDLCLSLRSKGYVPVILVAGLHGRSSEEARKHGLIVDEVEHDPNRVAAWLSKMRPSLILSHHCYFELDQFKAAGIPIVEVLHNAYFWQIGEQYIASQRQKNVSEYVAVSDFVREYAVTHLNLPRKRITTISNGLSIAGFLRPPIELMNAQRLQTLNRPLLAFVANLHPQKNHCGVIQAFARVLKEIPAAQLKIAGAFDGNKALRRRIEACVRDLDLERSVEFLGPVDRKRLSRLLAEAHIGLLPTHLEGFSIVSLEYAFYGLPSILSDTGAARSLEHEYGHVLIAQNCALPAEQLNGAAIDAFAYGREPPGVTEIADCIFAQLKDYPTWLRYARSAAERYAAYSIEVNADRYMTLIKGLRCLGERDGSQCAKSGNSNRGAVPDWP